MYTNFCCGLQQSMRNADHGDIDLFEDSKFKKSHGVQDNELKSFIELESTCDLILQNQRTCHI